MSGSGLAGTWESHHAITGLMFDYADCVDRGDYDGIGALFAGGRMVQPDGTPMAEGAEAITALYHFTTKLHPDGSTRARHVNTNIRLDIDEVGGVATARSVFVVFQATERVPLQPIVSGRYRDRFERHAGTWRFAEREIDTEMIGEISDHLTDSIIRMLTQGRA
jgi:3-phenylpropionate/cinnamic acid dioxygenase small subunit